MITSFPSAGIKWVNVGVVEKSDILDGIIFVKPTWGDRLGEVTLDPTGFDFPQNITLTYSSVARTISLSGTFQGYWRGNAIPGLTNSWTSAAHPAGITVPYYLYFDGTQPVGSQYVWSSTPWIFSMLQIAIVIADAGGVKFVQRECHGTMNWSSHQEFHRTIGTYLQSGADLSNYTLASTTLKYPYVAETQIVDEDCPSILSVHNSGNNYTIMTLTGTGTATFTTGSATIVPVSGTNPYWNNYTGTWTQTLMSNNSYSSVWLLAVPVAADTTSQLYRYIWVQGQSNGTLAGQPETHRKSLPTE